LAQDRIRKANERYPMQLGKSVKFRKERFGAVLFHTESERVFTLNQAAAAIVEEIRPGREEADIVSSVRLRFKDPQGSIEQDVHALLATLRERGLVRADAA
jgi:PqqD family protein of HPr-rel-A system